ncbi:DUF3108 domain-containing protein [Rhodobacterales bacterium HKCCE2091]|nr:DUF3108 domain-containing protein [Rhodobacterales bacterium HKCCE2091]
MIRIVAVTLGLVLMAAGVPAQTAQQEFDVRFGGVRVARLVLAAREDGGAYAVAGRAESTGMVAVFRSLRFDMEAAGRIDGERPVPASYAEDVDTGRRVSTVTLRFSGGRPVVDAITPADPPQPWDVDPAAQAGAVDPLSALYRLARPRLSDALCGWSEAVFDGRRRSDLVVGPPVPMAGGVACEGLYRRVAGFPPEDLAERRDFPFTAFFSETAEGRWVLTRVDLQSLYGAVRITRN